MGVGKCSRSGQESIFSLGNSAPAEKEGGAGNRRIKKGLACKRWSEANTDFHRPTGHKTSEKGREKGRFPSFRGGWRCFAGCRTKMWFTGGLPSTAF